MKTTVAYISMILLAVSSAAFSESKKTADFLRLDPKSHADKEVTVDVSMVKPVRWKSPVEDIAFFHALTIDRDGDKSGGAILVAVPAADSEKFAKKYGMNFEGRKDKTTLRGIFILASRGGPSGLWMIDTTGKIPLLLADKKLELPAAAADNGDFGPKPPRGRRGPR